MNDANLNAKRRIFLCGIDVLSDCHLKSSTFALFKE